MAFDKILIANRGEIAVRVMRTAKRLGYRTVAVYSTADAEALHVERADEAVAIGPPAASESYLSIERVLEAAKSTGATAIHPGYGFLSENAAFARACANAGVTFIGPPADAIELMGNKRAAKLEMIKASVPCVPGYEGDDQSDATLVKEAKKIGFPAMVKAAAGGGGRGMRLVESADDLDAAISGARTEAENAFGSGELILEKAVVRPRHVEIQVFGDSHGNVLHLGERDCSVQRRHQKVVEESPSPAVDAALRAKMGEAGVAAAKACNYVGAGTVEFLLDENGEFHFLEMNTRLQVEHPVTELVTGIDLVEWQIRVASGEALPTTQDRIDLCGHAIEVRLYAEDPARGYVPQTGDVLRWQLPEGVDVRVDHGVREGGRVSPHYDPMLAKVIAHGGTRDEARRKLVYGLEDLTLLGVITNKTFLANVLENDTFGTGGATTAFLSEHFADDRSLSVTPPPPEDVALAAIVVFLEGARGIAEDDTFIGWRSGGPIWVTVKLASGDVEHAVKITAEGRGSAGRCYAVSNAADGADLPPIEVEVVSAEAGAIVATVGGVRRRARYTIERGQVWVDTGRNVHVFEDVTHAPAASADGGSDGIVLAPLDGKVIELAVAEGDTVDEGQLLLVLEAMKMEHRIRSEVAGSLASLGVSVGDQVKTRQKLAEITPAGEA